MAKTGQRERIGSRRRAARALVAAALVVTSTAAAARAPQPGLRVTINGEVLRISGLVPRDLPGALTQILDAHPQVRTVLLDSPGGEVIGGLSTASLIRRRGLNTMVPANSDCASACVILLAAGVERRVAPATRVGVHRWKYSRAVTQADWNRDSLALKTAFVGFGVSGDIVDMMLAVPHEAIRWLTASEMRALRLVTTEVAGP